MARSKAPGSLVTHRDPYQVSIEIDTINAILRSADRMLDMGCGNGYATAVYARRCRTVVGVDYSCGMIAAAYRAYRRRNLSFVLGDVFDLPFKRGDFTAIISTRFLINLTDWQAQKAAIRNLHNLLPKGGRLILAEGIRQGRAGLNGLRVAVGLRPMPKVWHNIDFDESRLMPFLKGLFVVDRDIRFGVYDVLTRVYYPARIYPRQPRYGTRYQAQARQLYDRLDRDLWREYSREACLVLIKK